MSGVNLAERYTKHHFPGADCRVTSLRNLLDYFGMKDSYSAVAGLSSSVGFTYRTGATEREKALDPDLAFLPYFRPISGYRIDCIDKAAQNYNAVLLGNYPDDPDASLDRMRGFLREGIPVLVAVSRRALSHQPYRFPRCLQGIDFGGHWALLVGIDDAAKTVTLFDTDTRMPLECSQEVFQRARCHGDGHSRVFMQSRNRWMVFVPHAEQPSRHHLITVALTRVLVHMRMTGSGLSVHVGLHGLQRLAEDLPRWRTVLECPDDVLRATVFMLRVNNMLSAGGLGRRTFATFLRHAAGVCRSDALHTAATASAEAGRLWDTFIAELNARILEAPEPAALDVPEVTLQHIIAAEHRVADHIQQFLER